MFSKVFKYDFKFFFRIWWIAALSISILSVGGGFMIRGFDNRLLEENTVYVVLATLSVIAIIITAALLPIVVLILAAVRYYQNLFSDQGYLTFTLPVKRSHHLNSKLLVYVLFQIMSMIVLSFSASMAIYIGFHNTNMAQQFNESFGVFLHDFSNYFTTFGQTTEIIIYGVMLIAYFFMGINSLYMSITIGATLAKKHKALAAIGVFYGLNFGINFISRLVRSLLLTQSMIEADSFITASTINLGHTIFSAIFFAALAVLFHFLNLYFIKNKLNLS